MFVLFHLVFELAKIAVLSTVYATVFFLIFKIISNGKLKKDRIIWGVSFFVIYPVLLVYMFTYWGDHGLGDEAIIPIGHHKTVQQIDGVNSHIEDKDGNQAGIDNFYYNSDRLYAIPDAASQIPGDYIVWNLAEDHWKVYKAKEYQFLIASHQIPTPIMFASFETHYGNYWHGWRFWLLP